MWACAFGMKNYLEYYDDLISILTDDLRPVRPNERGRSWLVDLHSRQYIAIISNLKDVTYEYVSPRAKDVVGFTSDALQAMGPFGINKLIHPDYIQWYIRVFECVSKIRPGLELYQRLRAQLNMVVPVKHKSGAYIWIESQSIPIKLFPNGALAYVFVLIQRLPLVWDGTDYRKSFIRIPDNEGQPIQHDIDVPLHFDSF